MDAQVDRIAGVSLDIEDLIRVRGQLTGLSLSNILRRSSYRSGARETRIRGRGMEYEESRVYVAGDDMRTMDWRVMARTGEAHTKIFAEEKERRYLLAVDLSASMFYGTHSAFKSYAAALTAAHVGWLASFAGERLGGLIVAPELHYEVRPGKSRTGLMTVFHHLAEISRIDQPAPGLENRFNFLLRELQRVVKPGSIISLVSDFIGVDDESAELLSALVRHNDVNAFWIYDETEATPWPAGRYQVRLREQQVEFELNRRDSWLGEHQQAHRARVEALMSGFNLPLFPVCCNREINPQILHNLALT